MSQEDVMDPSRGRVWAGRTGQGGRGLGSGGRRWGRNFFALEREERDKTWEEEREETRIREWGYRCFHVSDCFPHNIGNFCFLWADRFYVWVSVTVLFYLKILRSSGPLYMYLERRRVECTIRCLHSPSPQSSFEGAPSYESTFEGVWRRGRWGGG